MRVGIVTGSGTYALPGLEAAEVVTVATPYGDTEVTLGSWFGVDVVHVARHGRRHERLSNLVNHRANVFAVKARGAEVVIGLTACGAVDPTLELGQLVIFGDLYFPSNRLPDGSLCTFFDAVGDPSRGHWILNDAPYSSGLFDLLTAAAIEAGVPFQSGGIYGHVDGPRFNTPAEIASLAASGVCAVSQTCGPETVLCGELELPYALVGFVTDFANGVIPGDPTPVAKLAELMGRAPAVFAELLREALPSIAAAAAAGRLPAPAGTMFRFGSASAPAPAPSEAPGPAAAPTPTEAPAPAAAPAEEGE